MRNKIIAIILLIVIAGISIKLFNDSMNDKLLNLSRASIQNQYNPDESAAQKLYSKQFFDTKDKLGKTKDKYYKILYIEVIKKDLIKGKYLVNARIQDNLGEYFEHIYITRENNNFLIYNIEKDI